MSPVVGVIVSAALALGPAPRLPDRFEDIEAQVQELAAQERYEALAITARAAFERKSLAPDQRRLMGFFAIEGLHGMFQETGDVASLCDAQRLLRRIAREGAQDDTSTVARLKKATTKYLANTGEQNPCSKPKTPKSPPLVAAAPAPAPDPAEPAPEILAPVEHANDDLVAVGSIGAPVSEHVAVDVSEQTDTDAIPASGTSTPPAVPEVPPTAPEGPTPAPRPADERRRTPNFTRGGIALLSIGAAAGAAFGASLHFTGRANHTIGVLTAAGERRGMSTPEEYARAHRLNESYQGLTVAAGLTGSIAAAAILGSVIMFAVKSRRTKTAAAPWAGPTGAGLTLRGHF